MRRALLPLVGLWAVAAGPGWAEDGQDRRRDDPLAVMEDVIDSVGGVLKVLVGPPISSPSPYMNLPYHQDAPTEAKPAGTAPPSPPEPAETDRQVPAPSLPTAIPAAAAPQPPPEPMPSPPAPPAATTPQPTAAAIAPPPPPQPRPARPNPSTAPHAVPQPPAAIAPAIPAPDSVSAPACSARVAATATVDQAARLPRCR